MKKIISLLLVALMVVGMFAGCSVGKDEKDPTNAPTQIPTTIPDVSGNVTEPSDEVVDPTEDTNEPSLALTATETVLNNIIEKQPMQFPTMVMPLDLTDVFAIESYTGLKSADGIVEGAFCEAMMGSQAFSLVLVKVADPANAEAVAKAMQEGINPRKWICVEADDLMVVATGDLVLLAMMDSEYSADATAKSTTDLFAQEYGELSVTLTGKPE
jgi:hypothetical protein